MIQVTALHANGTTTATRLTDIGGEHVDDARTRAEAMLRGWAEKAMRDYA
jgi:hypothetical protein